MNRFTYFLLFSLACFPLQSCHRKFVHKSRPEFIGSWYHQETNGEEWFINIDEKSWGDISVYDADGSYSEKYLYGENPYRWRYNEKCGELTHRIIPDRFKVNQLPSVAETTIISGHDTIPAGRTYCIIKDDYYIKTN